MIPFNKPYLTGKELEYISEAHENGHLSGDGAFTKRCAGWLENQCDVNKALLTHSCTAALEMAAILLNVQRGDEVIMPSFTFVSTANAFVLRGATPVFVDIRPDTLNIDEKKIEQAITVKTKAIIVVHYAGVACEMDKVMDISQRHGVKVIEDAAQGLMSSYKGKALGSIGDFGTLSFHETKNIHAGEGGALLINDPDWVERAETIREKGTNRKAFFRGEVDKYSWVDLGSSYLPSELVAAFLWAQIEKAKWITKQRMDLWQRYHREFEQLEENGIIRRPEIPSHCQHNAHIYYLLLPNLKERSTFIEKLKKAGVQSIFHYIPLHQSQMGMQCGRVSQSLSLTETLSDRVVRLPLWIGLDEHMHHVTEEVTKALKQL